MVFIEWFERAKVERTEKVDKIILPLDKNSNCDKMVLEE